MQDSGLQEKSLKLKFWLYKCAIKINSITFYSNKPNKSEEKISDFIKKTEAVVQPKQAWTDIARFFEHKIPCVNFGPGDPLLAHATNEHISKKQLLESYELLSGYLGVKSE